MADISEFEKSKWRKEIDIRERELELREKELELKRKESAYSGWKNPVVIAILTATIAFLGNTYLANRNNELQLELEGTKAEYTRILQALFTEMDKNWQTNMENLIQVELIRDPILKGRVQSYLAARQSNQSDGDPNSLVSEPIILNGCNATVIDGTCIGCITGYGQCTITNSDNQERANGASWSVQVPKSGYYRISLKYAAVEARPGEMILNETKPISKMFGKVTGSWTSGAWFVEHCTKLSAGNNTIKIRSAKVFPHIQNLMLQNVAEGQCVK